MNLNLPLKRRWFEMTKARIKPEDYREINEYWCKRLFKDCDKEMIADILDNLKAGWSIEAIGDWFLCYPKLFQYNIMTLGYPKSTDTERILKFKHAGIEIREGKSEWGAKPGRIYFVIKHGELIK